MRRTKVKMNKPIYLGLSILEISKILMYEFWYDYMKHQRNTRQTALFKLFHKLIRLELVEDSQILSSITNQSVKFEGIVNILTVESLEA